MGSPSEEVWGVRHAVDLLFVIAGLVGAALLCAAILDAAEYDRFVRSLPFL
jgi:hypothetical protein